MRKRASSAGFTLIELVVAMAVVTLVIVVAFNLFIGGTKESTVMIDKMAAQQETRLAFRRMCDEIKMGRKLVLVENALPFRPSDYRYDKNNESKQVQYGPSANFIFFENFDGDIISYFLYTILDEEKKVANRELRRLNVSRRMEKTDERSRVVATGVVAKNEKPSIFTIAKAYPGKQLSSVLVKLTVRESHKLPDRRSYSLITSVFLRNLDRSVEFDFDSLDDPNIVNKVN
ncbi:MAG: type II secretion system protein [bacterium]|nr:type II secretion system protein [bacterium]